MLLCLSDTHIAHGWFLISNRKHVPDAPKAKSECGIIIIEISKFINKKKIDPLKSRSDSLIVFLFLVAIHLLIDTFIRWCRLSVIFTRHEDVVCTCKMRLAVMSVVTATGDHLIDTCFTFAPLLGQKEVINTEISCRHINDCRTVFGSLPLPHSAPIEPFDAEALWIRAQNCALSNLKKKLSNSIQ